MILPDIILLAYQFDKNQYTPKPFYPSGKKVEDNLIDKYRINPQDQATLIIENDIINKDGNGLKKGFYGIAPDKYHDFLLISQSGKIIAKIPIIKMEVVERINTKQEKIEKLTQKQYERKKEKEYRKYLDGQNPQEVEFKEAQINYIEEENSYIIFYNTNNIKLIGVIKF